jgi:hypothetical protein
MVSAPFPQVRAVIPEMNIMSGPGTTLITTQASAKASRIDGSMPPSWSPAPNRSPHFPRRGTLTRVTEAEEYASTLVRTGFHDRDEVLEAVVESYEDDLSEDEAASLVTRLWEARLAEQATWPETTEVDRLLSTFATLDAAGVVARPNFTCCNNCGHTEIGAEAEGGARGYVFFHHQDTERAAEGGGLYLSYGAFGDGDIAAIGREVVAALTAAKLPTEWDGTAGQRILVYPLNWQLRLAS